MSDWRDLPAGRELDRVIGLAVNWNHSITDCDGEWMDDECEEVLPHYSTDANADLRLAEGEWLEIHEGWNGHTAARVVRTVTGKHGDWQEGATLAEARARAWLDWHDKQ